MADSPGDDYEKFEGTAQPVSAHEMTAEFLLFGRAVAADDEESQKFASDVRTLNSGWKPGDVPRVPVGYRSGAAYRAVLARMARPALVEARPREHRSSHRRELRCGRGRSRRGPPSGDDPPDDPEAPAASPFQAAWRSVLYLTAGELDALVSHAHTRIKVLRRRAA